MGILQKFKTLLKTPSVHRRDAEDDPSVLTQVRPGSATAASRSAVPAAGDAANPGSPAPPQPRRVDSARMALPRIDSITTTTQPGSRFETTIITRQGSCLVLQGVKTMKPDSDEEPDDDNNDVERPSDGPAPPQQPREDLGSAARSRPPSAAVPRHVSGNGIAPSAHSSLRSGGLASAINSASSPRASGPSIPLSPMASFNNRGGAAAAAVGGAAAGAAAGGHQGPRASRRPVNRVASLPLLLDGGLPRAPRPFVADDAPTPEHTGPQEPETRPRRPPKRAESLKYLLHLDQYGFNQDVSVQEAREAAAAGGAGAIAQGSLEDIISADGSTSSILAVSPALPARMRRPHWSLADYQLLKQLHRGYASDVYQARCKASGEMVALKVYKLAEQGDIQRMQLYREIKLHARLRHTNVVQYYACFLEKQRVILVTEFCTGGDLLRVMYKCGGRLFERQAVNLVLQPFLTALHYLHTQGIVHRDIKPENVLFAEGQVLKLADFGLAIDLKEERANTRAGTLDYMAPEVLRCPTKKTPDENKGNPQSQHYSTAVDAWAVGVFAYELIVGAPPFKAQQMIDTARNIMHAPVAFPDTISDLARDFICRALHKDSTERITVLEMLHHPWITMFQRRSSVRIVYTRSNSLMELVPPEAQQPGASAAHSPRGGGAGGAGGHARDGGGSGSGYYAAAAVGAGGSSSFRYARRGSGMGVHAASSEREREVAGMPSPLRHGHASASGGGGGWVGQAAQPHPPPQPHPPTPSRPQSFRAPLSADVDPAYRGSGSGSGTAAGGRTSLTASAGGSGGTSRLMAVVAAAGGTGGRVSSDGRSQSGHASGGGTSRLVAAATGGGSGLPPLEGGQSGSRPRTRMGPH
ncbi:hypothetical protein GPECTOR_28g813 [Gonium pectorale]|uniref:Protein kinase domain-containing protein n=1 Tax=Gonium pectorale TaxID=33097 RepID=A0A150GF09_GONPE|nr:hypothetical protein GPECTOR_28g813 [Gonium pectorale]|eukprot:KXZ48406.1 hypothetical protein GPECTOR_28g813 [Gonium pectorale]